MAHILVIDDDKLVQKSFSRLFRDKGHEVILADTLSTGERSAQQGVDLIYLDLDLPDGDGLGLIDKLVKMPGNPEVIVITGMGSDYAARKSMESNAWDYIAKPASSAEILETLDSALTYRKNVKKKSPTFPPFDPCGIIGQSPSIQRSLQDIARAASSETGVLILGETGVGKELGARAVHLNSNRKDKPFVVVDCSSLTETLVESILYGHLKGAFTGAHTDRKGLVAQADGGTLFLDEVGELPPELQKSFLRVLQEHQFRPVGSDKELHSDFRLVAATNRDLNTMAEQGKFRSDLLYRLKTFEVNLPPLRERGDDIELLAYFFINRTCDRYGIDNKEVSDELLKVVANYHWSGNIRELMNVMDSSVIQAGTDSVIYPKHLPAHIRLEFLKNKGQIDTPDQSLPDNTPLAISEKVLPYSNYKRGCDHQYFTLVMQQSGNDINRVSQLSGLSVPSIYRYLSQLGISTKKGTTGK